MIAILLVLAMSDSNEGPRILQQPLVRPQPCESKDDGRERLVEDDKEIG